MEFTASDLIQLVGLTVLIIALFLVHRSVPTKQVDELISVLKGYSSKTTTPIDDEILRLVAVFRSMLPAEPIENTKVIPEETAEESQGCGADPSSVESSMDKNGGNP